MCDIATYVVIRHMALTQPDLDAWVDAQVSRSQSGMIPFPLWADRVRAPLNIRPHVQSAEGHGPLRDKRHWSCVGGIGDGIDDDAVAVRWERDEVADGALWRW
jgi:hypothetical protein